MKNQKGKEAKVKMFTTTITLPEEVYKRLKHLAVDEGKKLRQMMSDAIEEYLSRKEKGGKR